VAAAAALAKDALITFVGIPEIIGLLPVRETWHNQGAQEP
jgi:hypothetical protein